MKYSWGIRIFFTIIRPMVAFIILLVSVLLSRIILERANSKLDLDKKAALLSLFSKERIWRFAILIVTIIIYFITIQLHLISPVTSYFLYFLFLVGFSIFTSVSSYQKLQANAYPKEYIQSSLLSNAIVLGGLIVFFILMVF